MVSVDSGSGDREDESIVVGVGRYDLLKCSQRWLCKSAGKEWFCNCFLSDSLVNKDECSDKKSRFCQ